MSELAIDQLKNQYDFVVIGAGSGGLTAAIGLTKAGKEVLLISENIGGDCTHFGCVPSKTLLNQAKLYQNTDGEKLRKQVANAAFAVVGAKVEEIYDEDLRKLEEVGVSYIRTRARFASKSSVFVEHDSQIAEVSFTKCVLATGSAPRAIQIPNIPEEKLLNNEQLFNLSKMPQSIAIVGGGPIGIEMATAFGKLGTKVHLIERNQTILKRDPLENTETIRRNLERYGVSFYFNIEKQIWNEELLELFDTQQVHVGSIEEPDYVLAAVGRTPNTSLGLDIAGVAFDKTGVFINKRLRTSNSRIYAIGDVTTAPRFTHVAYTHAKQVVTQEISKGFIQPKASQIPAVTFCDPPLASVGKVRETRAIGKYYIPFYESDRGLIEEDSMSKGYIFADRFTGRIVGASFVGDFAEEAINLMTLAINQKISLREFNDFIVPYPTYSSALDRAMLQWLSELKANFMRFFFGWVKRQTLLVTILSGVVGLGVGLLAMVIL